MPNSPTPNELTQFTDLADKIASLALHQCSVYAASVPTSLVVSIPEPRLEDRAKTLAYAVSKALAKRLDPIQHKARAYERA